jgi:iron complex transport system permease protein
MRSRKNPKIVLTGLLLALLILSVAATNIGALKISLTELWQTPFNEGLWDIWLNIRLPRVLLAVLVGLALALSGAIMQGLFRNPLADPSLLGISTGAALCVALVIVLPFSLPPIISLYGHIVAAFVGSLAVCLLVYSLSIAKKGSLTKLLLAGIAINALCSSGIGLLTYISDEQQLRQFSLWTMGSLGRAEWSLVITSATFILPAAMLSLYAAKPLNLLQLGEEEAHYLGVNVRRTKLFLLFLSALLVGVAVSVSGIIGFVGLVMPHLIRMQIGADHRWLIPGAALGGAALLLLADTIARTAVAPMEMPVGLLTSLIGGPYFLWLILRHKGA